MPCSVDHAPDQARLEVHHAVGVGEIARQLRVRALDHAGAEAEVAFLERDLASGRAAPSTVLRRALPTARPGLPSCSACAVLRDLVDGRCPAPMRAARRRARERERRRNASERRRLRNARFMRSSGASTRCRARAGASRDGRFVGALVAAVVGPGDRDLVALRAALELERRGTDSSTPPGPTAPTAPSCRSHVAVDVLDEPRGNRPCPARPCAGRSPSRGSSAPSPRSSRRRRWRGFSSDLPCQPPHPPSVTLISLRRHVVLAVGLDQRIDVRALAHLDARRHRRIGARRECRTPPPACSGFFSTRIAIDSVFGMLLVMPTGTTAPFSAMSGVGKNTMSLLCAGVAAAQRLHRLGQRLVSNAALFHACAARVVRRAASRPRRRSVSSVTPPPCLQHLPCDLAVHAFASHVRSSCILARRRLPPPSRARSRDGSFRAAQDPLHERRVRRLLHLRLRGHRHAAPRAAPPSRLGGEARLGAPASPRVARARPRETPGRRARRRRRDTRCTPTLRPARARDRAGASAAGAGRRRARDRAHRASARRGCRARRARSRASRDDSRTVAAQSFMHAALCVSGLPSRAHQAVRGREAVAVGHPAPAAASRWSSDRVGGQDVVEVQHVGGQRVDLVGGERLRRGERHRAADVVPQRRRVVELAAGRAHRLVGCRACRRRRRSAGSCSIRRTCRGSSRTSRRRSPGPARRVPRPGGRPAPSGRTSMSQPAISLRRSPACRSRTAASAPRPACDAAASSAARRARRPARALRATWTLLTSPRRVDAPRLDRVVVIDRARAAHRAQLRGSSAARSRSRRSTRDCSSAGAAVPGPVDAKARQRLGQHRLLQPRGAPVAPAVGRDVDARAPCRAPTTRGR